MKRKIEIQIVSPLTRQQLIEMRDEIRLVEGWEAFDLTLPAVPFRDANTMGGDGLTEIIVHGLIGGIIHFSGEAGSEFVYHRIKSILKKFKPIVANAANLPESMGVKTVEAVVSEQDEGSTRITYLDGDDGEKDLSGREYSINPQLTQAVLIGISDYDDSTNFPRIPPIPGNLNGMYAALIDKRLMGLPIENVHSLCNESSVKIIKQLNSISRIPGMETFIVYFAGHGQNTLKKSLSLIARDTHNIDERLHSDIPYEELERVIKGSSASQKIVILDACHSGLATQGPNISTYEPEPVYGSYILASTSADEVSYFKPDAESTYFTGYLLKILNEGIKNVHTMLSLNDIFKYTSEQLQKHNFPPPRRKFDIKNVDESHFYISPNPSFDVGTLKKRPVELVMQGRQEEAEIVFYKLLKEYPEDTSWVKEYEEIKKDVLFNKLVLDGDRFLMQGKLDEAKQQYLQAKALNNTSFINLKILECNKMIAQRISTAPEISEAGVRERSKPKPYLMFGLIATVLVAVVWILWVFLHTQKNTLQQADKTNTPPVSNSKADSKKVPEQVKAVAGNDSLTHGDSSALLNSAAEGKRLYVANNYDKAFPLLYKAKDIGDNDVWLYLGHEYYWGRGVSMDKAEAFRWYMKAATAGNSWACFHVSLAYSQGSGVNPDAIQSANWAERSAELGNDYGQNEIAEKYLAGKGVARVDLSLAASWFQKSADQGNAFAQNNLGEMYEKGVGPLPKDLTRAVALYRKAAAQKNDEAKANLRRLGYQE